jgi:hypothetical protein
MFHEFQPMGGVAASAFGVDVINFLLDAAVYKVLHDSANHTVLRKLLFLKKRNGY